MSDLSDGANIPDFGSATLTDCDREPIHIPGSIQEHGCLIAVDPVTRRILHAGGDFTRILGIDLPELLGASLEDAFGPEKASQLAAATLGRPFPIKTFYMELKAAAGDATVIVHKFQGLDIIEFEPAASPVDDGANEMLLRIQRILALLDDEASIEAFHRSAAILLRDFTGFGRVMIYQFLDDGSGRVVAEARDDDMASYLDLHFPETDIPKQARALYRQNWLRLIPNVDYRPRPLVSLIEGPPLDLSYATLRSVSPIHLQYLKNMGVAASMSISIVVNEQLWGLVACHHPKPHFVSYPVRASCEIFGQIFSLQLKSRLNAQNYEYRLKQRNMHVQLVRRLSQTQDLSSGLILYHPNLLDYIHADGVAIVVDGQYLEFGRTPGRSLTESLIAKLGALDKGVFATDCLATFFPQAADHAAEASGILALSISRLPRDYIIWFRQEILQTVTWAGNPHKSVSHAGEGDPLQPRASFAAWQEVIKGRSREWRDVEIEAAQALRLSILEVVLARIDQIARERAQHGEHQALLIAELDHRVKNTLANIQALMRFTRDSSESLNAYVQNLEKRINAMAYAHSLLSQNRWQGAELSAIVREELAQYRNSDAGQVAIDGDDVSLTPKAALTLSLFFHELATNAAKYGALTTAAGTVTVHWRWEHLGGSAFLNVLWQEQGGPRVLPPLRKGFGCQLIETSVKYELGAEVDLQFLPEGLMCELRVPQENMVDARTTMRELSNTMEPCPEHLKILVVEDSFITAMDIERMLQRAGHTVLGPTGRVTEAMSLLQSSDVDLAILDINLGNADSFEIADTLTVRHIPFFFLSGYAAESVLPQRFADHPCLGKPFTEPALNSLISEARR